MKAQPCVGTTALWNFVHSMKNVQLVLGGEHNAWSNLSWINFSKPKWQSSDGLDLIMLISDYLLQVYMLDEWEETGRRA